MKKISRTEQLKLARQAQSRWQKVTSRRQWRGQGKFKPLVLLAPRILSFSKNGSETIKFFEKLKSAIFTKKIAKRKGEVRPQPFRIDLQPIKEISVPTAVVLAAELHRWSLSRKTSLKTSGLNNWSPRVRSLLWDLGVFDLLGIRAKQRPGDTSEQLVLLRLKSSTKREGESTANLQTWLREMGVVFREKKFVFGALDEAILNCIEHGYVDLDVQPRFPYAGHRWWATSCYDPNNDSLRFFVYDQGVGIPACLPTNKDFWPSVRKIVAGITGDSPEANIIESAFEVGRTRTHKAERGKGLDKMRDAIRLAGDGYLRVISGKGDLSLGHDQTMKKCDHDLHIGGTLIEWSIPLAALQGTGDANG